MEVSTTRPTDCHQSYSRPRESPNAAASSVTSLTPAPANPPISSQSQPRHQPIIEVPVCHSVPPNLDTDHEISLAPAIFLACSFSLRHNDFRSSILRLSGSNRRLEMDMDREPLLAGGDSRRSSSDLSDNESKEQQSMIPFQGP